MKTQGGHDLTAEGVAPGLKTKLNQHSLHLLDDLFTFVPPKKLKQHILNVFLMWLAKESPNTLQSHREIAEDYQLLFNFLDAADEDIESKTISHETGDLVLTEHVKYSPELKKELELVRRTVELLVKEEPEKSVEQFLDEIDFIKDQLEAIQLCQDLT